MAASGEERQSSAREQEARPPPAVAPLKEIHLKFRMQAQKARAERDASWEAPAASHDACINPPHLDVADVTSKERASMARQETIEGREEVADPDNPRQDPRSCPPLVDPTEMSPVPLLPLVVSHDELLKLTLQSFPGHGLNWAETGRREFATVLASMLCRGLVTNTEVEKALGGCDRFYALLKYPSHAPSRRAAAAAAAGSGGEPAAAPRRRPGRQRPHHRPFGETALFQRERTFMNNGLLAGVCMVQTGIDPAPAPPAPPAPAAAEPEAEARSSRSSSRGSSDSEREAAHARGPSRALRVARGELPSPRMAWRAAIIKIFCAAKVGHEPDGGGNKEYAGPVLMRFVCQDLRDRGVHTLRLYPSDAAVFSQFYERMGFLCWKRYEDLIGVLPDPRALDALNNAKRQSSDFMMIKPLVALTGVLLPREPRTGIYGKYLDGICISDDAFEKTVLADKNANSEGALMRRQSPPACMAYVAAYNAYRKKIFPRRAEERGMRERRAPIDSAAGTPPPPLAQGTPGDGGSDGGGGAPHLPTEEGRSRSRSRSRSRGEASQSTLAARRRAAAAVGPRARGATGRGIRGRAGTPSPATPSAAGVPQGGREELTGDAAGAAATPGPREARTDAPPGLMPEGVLGAVAARTPRGQDGRAADFPEMTVPIKYRSWIVYDIQLTAPGDITAAEQALTRWAQHSAVARSVGIPAAGAFVRTPVSRKPYQNAPLDGFLLAFNFGRDQVRPYVRVSQGGHRKPLVLPSGSGVLVHKLADLDAKHMYNFGGGDTHNRFDERHYWTFILRS
jgi:hypothetical protein